MSRDRGGRVQARRSAATGGSAQTTQNPLGHRTLRPRQAPPASARPPDTLAPVPKGPVPGRRGERPGVPVLTQRGPKDGSALGRCPRPRGDADTTGSVPLAARCDVCPLSARADRVAAQPPQNAFAPEDPVRTAAAARPPPARFPPASVLGVSSEGTRTRPAATGFSHAAPLCRGVSGRSPRRQFCPSGCVARPISCVSPEGRLAVPTLRPGGRRCRERVHRCPGRARLCTPRSGSAGSHADHSGRASRPLPAACPVSRPRRAPDPGSAHPTLAETTASRPGPGSRGAGASPAASALKSNKTHKTPRCSQSIRLYSNENHTETRTLREENMSSRSQLQRRLPEGQRGGRPEAEGRWDRTRLTPARSAAEPGCLAHALASGHCGGDAGPPGSPTASQGRGETHPAFALTSNPRPRRRQEAQYTAWPLGPLRGTTPLRTL